MKNNSERFSTFMVLFWLGVLLGLSMASSNQLFCDCPANSNQYGVTPGAQVETIVPPCYQDYVDENGSKFSVEQKGECRYSEDF
jgi:hypothetical protein